MEREQACARRASSVDVRAEALTTGAHVIGGRKTVLRKQRAFIQSFRYLTTTKMVVVVETTLLIGLAQFLSACITAYTLEIGLWTQQSARISICRPSLHFLINHVGLDAEHRFIVITYITTKKLQVNPRGNQLPEIGLKCQRFTFLTSAHEDR